VLSVPECVNCIVDDLCAAVRSEVADESVQLDVLRKSLAWLAREFTADLPPPYFVTGVHRILKRVAGIDEPFKVRRDACNRVGTALAERVRDRIQSLDGFERFAEVVRWTVAGNMLDFRSCGTGYEFEVSELENMLSVSTRAIDVDKTGRIFDVARRARNVLYVHDNVGEVALDRLLVDELRALGAHVTSALRGGPITSDATVADGDTVGIAASADDVLCAGPDTLGVSLAEMTDEFRAGLAEADLVVAKGQANFCVLTECPDDGPTEMVFLLWTKCDLVSRCFGLTGKISVATVRSMSN